MYQVKKINDYQLVNINKIYYVDDRLNNLEIVKKNNINIITYHCYMYKLYQFKYLL
jgi:hypothetical protein